MEKALRCKLCCEEFSSVHVLNVHIERQHDINRDRKTKNFKCHRCGYVFSSEQHFVYHMRTHTGERSFKCTIIDGENTFKDGHTSSDHIKYKHNDDSRLFKREFPGCRNSARTSVNLFQNQKSHSDERPFACTKCDFKTALEVKLKLHMRRHTARRDFKCSHPQCTKYFKHSRDLEGHFNRRHEERNIRCDHSSGLKKLTNATTALRERKRNVHAKVDHASSSLNCSFSTNKSTTLAEEVIAHERNNAKILSSMDQNGQADSFGFACMLCDFVGYSEGAALDHAKCHWQPALPF